MPNVGFPIWQEECVSIPIQKKNRYDCKVENIHTCHAWFNTNQILSDIYNFFYKNFDNFLNARAMGLKINVEWGPIGAFFWLSKAKPKIRLVNWGKSRPMREKERD